MTDNILHSSWYMNGEYGVSFYIGSAMTPTDYEVERAQFVAICQKYIPFIDYESYVDDGNFVTFYDVQAQLDAHAAEADDIRQTQDDASYRSQ